MNLINNYNDDYVKIKIYENRFRIGKNLLDIINDNGYTKSSFSKLTGISRPTIDKLILGKIDNNTTLKTHMDKILNILNITLEQFINYNYKVIKNSNEKVIASNNAPNDYEISGEAKKIFSAIDDLVDLCEIYCDR